MMFVMEIVHPWQFMGLVIMGVCCLGVECQNRLVIKSTVPIGPSRTSKKYILVKVVVIVIVIAIVVVNGQRRQRHQRRHCHRRHHCDKYDVDNKMHVKRCQIS